MKICNRINQNLSNIIEKNNWKITEIQNGIFHVYDDFNSSNGSMNIFRIEAPNGIIKLKKVIINLSFKTDFGLVKVLQYFNEISNYNSWKEFDIKKENENLRKEIEELKRKNRELITEIKNLENIKL